MLHCYYYHAPEGNFGDDLNREFWGRVLPRAPESVVYHGIAGGTPLTGQDILLTGIGTILDSRLPREAQKWVVGSGTGYHSTFVPDERTRVYFVRGPGTAAKLGLSRQKAITDPAILVASLYDGTQAKPSGVAFLPHHSSLHDGVWKRFCGEIGWRYIDPRQSPAAVAASLGAAELVVTEAMHGAIFADALRRPWIPVVTHQEINSFKWQDWCSSLEMEYQPHQLPALHYPTQGRLGGIRRLAKWQIAKVAAARLMRTAVPQLSQETVYKDRLVRVREQLELLQHDIDRVLSGQVPVGLVRT